MAVTAVIHARMGSSRVPGKVLRPFAGRPLLGWTLSRLGRCAEVKRTVVAIPDGSADDRLADWLEREGVPIFRGPEVDLCARMLAAAEAFELAELIRVNGDSPLIDPVVVSAVVGAFERGGAELATNVYPRSFPVGTSVEVVEVAALARAHSQMSEDADREHVTRFIYRHPDRFRIRNISAAEDFSDRSLAVDDPDDARRIEALIEAHGDDALDLGWRELVDLLEPTTRTPR